MSLVYRLPTVPPRQRTLLLLGPGRAPLSSEGWGGEAVLLRVAPPAVPLHACIPGAFDRAVLHWTLDDVGRAGSRSGSRQRQMQLLEETRRVLAPGGAVVGCVDNLLPRESKSEQLRLGRSFRSCARLLQDAGFQDVEVWLALPSADAPRTLVSAEYRAAAQHFRRQHAQQRNRGWLHRTVHAMLATAGLQRHVQGSLVFSGRIPC